MGEAATVQSVGGRSEFALAACCTATAGCDVAKTGSGCFKIKIMVMMPAITDPTGGAMTNHIIG
jgi:hypothetical protein